MDRPKGTLKIAIDGPSGAGKTTVACLLAEQLGLLHIDTGAMYRALTLYLLRQGVDIDDPDSVKQALGKASIDMAADRVLLNGEDVSDLIRQQEVSQAVSMVARLPQVRQRLVESQREMARRYDVVMDGRDVGTVVLPDADVKVFLTADPLERAKRRTAELQAKGISARLDEILESIVKRDRLDSQRQISPLRPADDAFIIDTTDKTIPEVVEEIVELCRKNGAL